MKRFLILAIASIITTQNSHAIDTATNTLAYTLAQTIYVAALGMASTEATSLSISGKNQKEEAMRIQNEAQNYYQNHYASIYLESKMQLARELSPKISDDEAVDLLVEASKIILGK